MAAGILARVPTELDALNEEVVVTACIGLGFARRASARQRIFAIEFGNGALVDSLPGVPGGSSFVGSFDREEAVEDETIDFFASGHPLVEGIFAHYEEQRPGPRRAGRSRDRPGTRRGPGGHLQGRARVRGRGVRFSRRARPDWAAAFHGRSLRVSGVIGKDRDWTAMVRRLGALLDPARRPHALAAIVVRPPH